MTDLLVGYIQAVASYAPTWGLLLIFLFMTIESSFVPFPSEVVMVPAGFLAARGGLLLGQPLADAMLAVAAGVFGSLAGACVNYFLFSWLGSAFLGRYGRYFFLPQEKLVRAEELFRQYGAGATFVCRLLPAIRQLISIPAGIAGMPIKSFVLWTGLGAGIWVSVLAALGYTLGLHTAALSYPELVHQATATLRQHFVWIGPSLLVALLGYVWLTHRIMQSRQRRHLERA